MSVLMSSLRAGARCKTLAKTLAGGFLSGQTIRRKERLQTAGGCVGERWIVGRYGAAAHPSPPPNQLPTCRAVVGPAPPCMIVPLVQPLPERQAIRGSLVRLGRQRLDLVQLQWAEPLRHRRWLDVLKWLTVRHAAGLGWALVEGAQQGAVRRWPSLGGKGR